MTEKQSASNAVHELMHVLGFDHIYNKKSNPCRCQQSQCVMSGTVSPYADYPVFTHCQEEQFLKKFNQCRKILKSKFSNHSPGWGATRKWPLIRPCSTHTVCSQTKITGSGFWFERTIVWSEVTSVWGWYDQRSLQDGNGLIRGGFKRTLVWSATISSWIVFFLFFIFLTERSWLCQEATKSSILITDTSKVWCFWSEPKGSSW